MTLDGQTSAVNHQSKTPATMKIIEQTHTRLVFREGLSSFASLIGWSGLIGGIPLLLAGLIISDAGVVRLSCQRDATQVLCEETRSRLLGFVEDDRQALGTITGAEVDVYYSHRSDGSLEQQSYLLLSRVDHPVETSIAHSHAEVAEQIGFFLESSEPSLVIEQDTRRSELMYFGVPLLLLFPTVAIAMLLRVVCLETLEIDRQQNQLRYRQRYLFKTRQYAGAIDDIQDIQVRPTGRDGDLYEVVLGLTAGRYHRLAASFNRLDVEKIADRVERFLKPQNANDNTVLQPHYSDRPST
jgi:hypothetical protein